MGKWENDVVELEIGLLLLLKALSKNEGVAAVAPVAAREVAVVVAYIFPGVPWEFCCWCFGGDVFSALLLGEKDELDDLFVHGVAWFELDEGWRSLPVSVDPSSSMTSDFI